MRGRVASDDELALEVRGLLARDTCRWRAVCDREPESCLACNGTPFVGGPIMVGAEGVGFLSEEEE